MKKILKQSLLAAVICALGFTACKPKKEVDVQADINKFKEHLAQNKSLATSATINTALGGVVYGPNGSYIEFKPNCFQNTLGLNVTGNVIINYLDASKPGDMFYNKMLPISGAENLLSGGEYFVSASQNGNPVFLKPFMNTEAKFFDNNKDITNMNFFRGLPVEDPNTNVNWLLLQNDSFASVFVLNGDTIDISSDSLGYANADRFISNPNYVQCNFTITGAPVTPNAFSGMCVYKDFNGYWPLKVTANGIEGAHIPSNLLVHFVVFGIYDNKFYRGVIKDINTINGNSYSIDLTEADPLTHKNWLNNL
jgi:hypothetical protein